MRAALAATAAALLAGATLAWLGGEDQPRLRAVATSGGGFELAHPAGWRAAAPGPVLHRADGRGAVAVQEQPRLEGSLADVERDLERRLKRRVPDARRVAGRVVQLATGPALSYTFVRERSGLVQGIVVAPAGARTVMIETAARGDAADVAREIGVIVRSLRPVS